MYNYKRREIDKIMKNNGFEKHHQRGSHAIYRNSKGEHISIGLNTCNGLIMRNQGKKYNLDLTL